MRITYLLDPSPLAERDDVAGIHADGLTARGHVVRIVATDRPTWLRGGKRAEWIDVDDWREVPFADDDVVIATSARTARLAAARAAGRAMYLAHVQEPATEDDPELRRLEVTPVVEDEVYRSEHRRENDPLRVLLAGASHAEAKGIADGYGAVAHARWFHQKLDLIREAPWAPSRDEPLDDVQEFHVGLTGEEMTRLLHSCDVVVVPSHSGAGVGLIATEAMAAGVPCLLTSTPAHRSIGEPHDFALFGPEHNAVELGERLIELLSDEELRERLRARGREVAEQWHVGRVMDRVEAALMAASS